MSYYVLKQIQLTVRWTVVVPAIAALMTTISLGRVSRTDSADDFSRSLYRPARHGSYSWMSTDQIEAILNQNMETTGLPAEQLPKLARHLMSLCERYGFDPAFILSLVQVESSFRPRVVSPAGAVGLMQIMPATAWVVVRDLAPPMDERNLKELRSNHLISAQQLMDPFFNLTLGVAYLSQLRERYRALHPYYLLAAYNLGPARMDELRSKKDFKPGKTREYFEAVRQGVLRFRTPPKGL